MVAWDSYIGHTPLSRNGDALGDNNISNVKYCLNWMYLNPGGGVLESARGLSIFLTQKTAEYTVFFEAFAN